MIGGSMRLNSAFSESCRSPFFLFVHRLFHAEVRLPAWPCRGQVLPKDIDWEDNLLLCPCYIVVLATNRSTHKTRRHELSPGHANVHHFWEETAGGLNFAGWRPVESMEFGLLGVNDFDALRRVPTTRVVGGSVHSDPPGNAKPVCHSVEEG